jgi:hypothetical protein
MKHSAIPAFEVSLEAGISLRSIPAYGAMNRFSAS